VKAGKLAGRHCEERSDEAIQWREGFTRRLANRPWYMCFSCQMLCLFGFWAHPAFGGSGFPLQVLSLPAVGLRDFRYNPLRGSLVRQIANALSKAGGKAVGFWLPCESVDTLFPMPSPTSMPKAIALGAYLLPCQRWCLWSYGGGFGCREVCSFRAKCLWNCLLAAPCVKSWREGGCESSGQVVPAHPSPRFSSWALTDGSC
jgi:hypothetical protein